MTSLHEELFTALDKLRTHKDRHVKGHSLALLKRLQELNPQDEPACKCEACGSEDITQWSRYCEVCLTDMRR